MTPQSFGAQAFRQERAARATPAFSFRDLLNDLQAGNPATGRNAEVLTELARAQGREANLMEPSIPLALLLDPNLPPDALIRSMRRDMTVAGVSGSQYLVGQDNGGLGLIDRLRHASLTTQVGVGVLPLPEQGAGSVAAPVLTADNGWTWLSDENAAGTPAVPVIGQANASPKSAIGLVKISGQLLRQAVNGEVAVNTILLRGFGELLDTAVLNGTGVSGQPMGLLNHAAINLAENSQLAVNGAEKILDAEKAIVEAGASRYAWLCDPATGAYLKSLPDPADADVLWRGPLSAGTLQGVPSYSSVVVPTNTLVGGPWDSVLVVVWGGLKVQADPYTAFNTGHITLRLLAMVDVLVPHPGAFVAFKAIS